MNIEVKTFGKVLTPEDNANVLCDGYSKAHRVTMPTVANEADWQEMTEVEADALIATNSDNEATEADYQSALAEMGVTFDEEV